jgi:DNA-binding response OmpR family regulator
MGGTDLLESLRAERPEILSILMSGFTGDQVHGGKLDGTLFLQKPFAARELLEGLQKLMNGLEALGPR